MYDPKNLLRSLCDACGPSGYEDEVRAVIVREAKKHSPQVDVDSMGNVYAELRGSGDGPKILIASHMDEVGFMINFVEESGFLRFIPLGTIDPKVLLAQRVTVMNKGDRCIGVIGTKPVHVQSAKELESPVAMNDLYIDVGARSKVELIEKGIDIGTTATFYSPFMESGINGSIVIGKAIDDRSGCAAALMAMEMLSGEKLLGNVTFAFTVQEEVGLRGATVAANRVQPELAIVLETAPSADLPNISPRDRITSVGKGPTIRIMDRTMITQRKILDYLRKVADSNRIPYQLQLYSGGGTDAGQIHLSGRGIPTGVISVPSKYLHTSTLMLDVEDLNREVELVQKVLLGIKSADQFIYSSN